jgi:hypothetical protein
MTAQTAIEDEQVGPSQCLVLRLLRCRRPDGAPGQSSRGGAVCSVRAIGGQVGGRDRGPRPSRACRARPRPAPPCPEDRRSPWLAQRAGPRLCTAAARSSYARALSTRRRLPLRSSYASAVAPIAFVAVLPSRATALAPAVGETPWPATKSPPDSPCGVVGAGEGVGMAAYLSCRSARDHDHSGSAVKIGRGLPCSEALSYRDGHRPRPGQSLPGPSGFGHVK